MSGSLVVMTDHYARAPAPRGVIARGGGVVEEESYRWFPDGLPDRLLGLGPRALLEALERPSLIRVPGTEVQPPRAVATLLHGDESTGFEAMLRVLRRRRRYPFDLYVLIGNVRAALADGGYAHRFLDDQEDFNRVWGLDEPTTALRRAADGVLGRLRAAGLESLVDVHNNTGNNPFYAIVTRDRDVVFNLATLFTTTLLRWDLDAATLMEALHDECPAIAVECGRAGTPESLAFAVDGLRRYLGEPELPTAGTRRDHDLFGGLRKVQVRPEVQFRFGGPLDDSVDLVVAEDADVHNFVEVPSGHVIGHVHPGAAMPLRATHGPDEVTAQFFAVAGETVVTTRRVTPVMMTRTVAAARKDCLFYVATELPPPR